MDLSPYTCRGLPGEFDRLMRDVPVAGIDREQAHAMVRLCAETEPILYGPDFSPRKIRYRRGSRPELERIDGDVVQRMHWVREHVQHPNLAGRDIPPDRAMSEEQLIASGIGWCNEQCRVFIALCEVIDVPARLCFLFHANGRTAHTAAEVWIDQEWAMFDVTYGVFVAVRHRRYAEAREIQRRFRGEAHQLYAAPLSAYYRDRQPPVDVNRGGDLFETIAFTNYLIDGVERVE